MKPRRILLSLAAGAALAIQPVCLRAQEAPAAPVRETPEGPERHGPDVERGTRAPAALEHGAGPAHEGAEHEGGHHGPPVKLFGHELTPNQQFAIKVVNFLIFAGGLVLLTKGALQAAFRARARELEERLSQAQKDRLEGEAQMKELEAKMAGLQAELDGLLQKAGVDAEAEKQRILEGARNEAAAILAQTRSDIENERKAAEARLRETVAELATQGAAKKLQAQMGGAEASTALDRAIEHIGKTGGIQ